MVLQYQEYLSGGEVKLVWKILRVKLAVEFTT